MSRFAFLALALLSIATSHAAQAVTRIAVLPSDAATNGPAMFRYIADAVSQLGTGDQLIIYAATPPRQIALIALPTDRTLNPARVRAELIKQLQPVREYLATMPPGLAGELPGQLMLPALMREIGENTLSALPDKNVHILVAGSFLFWDRKNPKVSFGDRYYASDGMLFAPRAESPFSTIGAQDRLASTTVHLCAVHAAKEFESAEHEERVKRFWTLWFASQGAKIGTVSSDLGTCWRRFNAGEAKGQPAYQMSRDMKAEMLRVPAQMAATLPASLDQPGQWFLRDDISLSTTPPSNTKGILWVGIRWSGTCDLDLYARGDASSPWLYFGSAKTAEGLFNKDFTSGTGEQYEFIEFTAEREVAKIEVAANIYSCEATVPPEATLRVWFGGKVYQAPIRFGSRTGNRAAQPMSGGAWVRVDLRKVLGVKE